jgi:hypothetical protein
VANGATSHRCGRRQHRFVSDADAAAKAVSARTRCVMRAVLRWKAGLRALASGRTCQETERPGDDTPLDRRTSVTTAPGGSYARPHRRPSSAGVFVGVDRWALPIASSTVCAAVSTCRSAPSAVARPVARCRRPNAANIAGSPHEGRDPMAGARARRTDRRSPTFASSPRRSVLSPARRPAEFPDVENFPAWGRRRPDPSPAITR